MRVLITLTVLVSIALCAQQYPGTNKRPILSDQEAASFTKTKYLQGWTPAALSTNRSDYTVDNGKYSSIQAAVNNAVKSGGTTRKYIKITAGIYNEVVYIPYTTVPITLYGGGGDPASTVIRFTVSSTSSGPAYADLVGKFFRSGDPAYNMYSRCANITVIGSICSCVVWVRAPNVQIINLTIENLSKKPGTDQAVALYNQADNFQVSKCRLLSHQNTFWAGTAAKDVITKGHVTDTHVEGDVDMVFGGGSVVFERCTFYARADRTTASYIFAPATSASHKYGYLVVGSKITGHSSYFTTKRAFLARAWDIGLNSSREYVAGSSSNGQLVVKGSAVDAIFPADAPYTSSTSGRPFSGNVNENRDLFSLQYDRFWEHANTGKGA